MKNFLLKITLFAPWLICFYVISLTGVMSVDDNVFGTNISFNRGGNGHLYSKIQELDSIDQTDILVLGSSLAYRGIDPRVFKQYDQQLFNLGSSAQTHIQTEVLLKRYLNIIRPKLVIYDVSPYLFLSDGVESSLDLVSNGPLTNDLLKMVFSVNHIKVYNALIYRLASDLTGKYSEYTEQVEKYNDTYISGGFVQKKSTSFKADNTGIINNSSLKPKSNQISAVQRNISLIKNSGSNLVLVSAPMSNQLFNRGRDYSYLDSIINEEGDYIIFRNKLNLVDSIHFYDQSHLNAAGVNAYNDALIDSLVQRRYFDY